MKAIGFTNSKETVYRCPMCGCILSVRVESCPNCECSITEYPEFSFLQPIQPKVYVDIDGVCLDTLGGLIKYLKMKHDVVLRREDVTDYDFDCGLPFDRQLIYSAFKDPEMWEYAKVVDGAREAIAFLRAKFDPQSYTTVIDNANTREERNMLVRSLGLGGVAYSGLKPTRFDAVALFDDNVAVHRQWMNDGFTGLLYLIDHPYNQPKNGDPVFERVIRVPSIIVGAEDLLRRYYAEYDNSVRFSPPFDGNGGVSE